MPRKELNMPGYKYRGTTHDLDKPWPEPDPRDTPKPFTLQPCGTKAAYRRHKARGEPIDDVCHQAKTARKGNQQMPTATISARSLPYRPQLRADEIICTRCGIMFRAWHPKRDGRHEKCRDCRGMN